MKKAKWAILGLTFILAVAVYVNWRFLNDDSEYVLAGSELREDDYYSKIIGEALYVSEESTYFENARYTRRKSRDEAVEVLGTLISNDSADSESKKLAAETIAQYAQITEKEQTVENLIKSKGYDDCIVFLTSDTASIVVETLGLEGYEAAQILDLASSETGLSPDVIKIIEFNSVSG